MKYFSLKFSKVFLSISVLFLVFSSNISASTESNSSKISVRDIVPSEYLAAYKGKFSSYEEVNHVAGFNGNSKNDVGKQNGAITVSSVDEYAALLFYFNDLTGSSQTIQHSTKAIDTSEFTTSASQPYTMTYDKNISDTGLMWIKAFVTVSYNSNGYITGTPTTASQIYGFHPGNSWAHSVGRSYVVIYNDGKTGYANVEGDLSLYIIIDGIGTVATKSLGTMIYF